MAGYIIRDREKTLVLPCRQVDQLLQAADGDAALLYLYLMRRTDAVTAEQIMQSLSMSALRLQAAQSRLEGMGLCRSLRGSRRSTPPLSWGRCCGTASSACWWRKRSGAWAKSSPPLT